jgi:rRNA maturation RNase YbeY
MNKIKHKVMISISGQNFQTIRLFPDKTYKNLELKIKLKIDRKELEKRIQFLLKLMCDFSMGVSIRFCDTAEMEQANSYFRAKNYPTDVLSFPAIPGTHFEDGKGTTSQYSLGDLLICIPVCVWQAKKAKQSLAAEIEKMIAHGLVHLKGFDHERDDFAWKVMSSLEKNLIDALRSERGVAQWVSET